MQKRKEGLGRQRPPHVRTDGDGEEGLGLGEDVSDGAQPRLQEAVSDEEESANGEDEGADARDSARADSNRQRRKGDETRIPWAERDKNLPGSSQDQNSQQSKARRKGLAESPDAEAPRSPSLRDLTREAYLPSALHTGKADPLHRRHDVKQRGGVPSARPGSRDLREVDHGSGARGGRGRGASSVRRGQPDMKLRMSAMLEKIKRDYS